MTTISKYESALDKFEKMLNAAEDRLGKLREVRYRRILENQQRFHEIQKQNELLQSQIAPPPVVTISS